MNETSKPVSATTTRRDEFWAQGVRGLFLINGGGAVALLTFLQAIWTTAPALVPWIVEGLVCFAFGVVLAAAVPILRSKTVEYWISNPSKGARYKLAYEWLSVGSIAIFLLGVLILAYGANSVVAGEPIGSADAG